MGKDLATAGVQGIAYGLDDCLRLVGVEATSGPFATHPLPDYIRAQD